MGRVTSRIEFYDPRHKRFIVRHEPRARTTDPLVIGHAEVPDERVFFLIAQRDLAADLAVLKPEKLTALARLSER